MRREATIYTSVYVHWEKIEISTIYCLLSKCAWHKMFTDDCSLLLEPTVAKQETESNQEFWESQKCGSRLWKNINDREIFSGWYKFYLSSTNLWRPFNSPFFRASCSKFGPCIFLDWFLKKKHSEETPFTRFWKNS